VESGGSGSPGRVVSLTGETEVLLRLLGVAGRIVARLEPCPPMPGEGRIAAASPGAAPVLDEIPSLRPDLVVAITDRRTEAPPGLAESGLKVCWVTPGSVEEVLGAIRLLGDLLGVPERGRGLARELEEGIERIREQGERLLRRPRIFFEEWPDPLLSAGGRVSELLELAGGEDLFRDLRRFPDEGERRVDPMEAARREPEAIIGSWRGRKLDPAVIRNRPGWERVPAVRRGKIYGMEASLVLDPGPTALSRGLSRLHEIIAEVSLG
jgi:iron complex transport system substrate-binding protein